MLNLLFKVFCILLCSINLISLSIGMEEGFDFSNDWENSNYFNDDNFDFDSNFLWDAPSIDEDSNQSAFKVESVGVLPDPVTSEVAAHPLNNSALNLYPTGIEFFRPLIKPAL